MANTGERLTVGHLLETELEHFHRYYLARHYARGKTVLDVASGEGYGAAILAQVATYVYGIDVSSEAVAHAQDSYTAPNLSYSQGDACRLPLADASVDMVTSFETIEHFYDHAAFLAEIKRVLRPGGLLILSTPDREIYSPPHSGANPHHVHELNKDEFHLLVAKYFNNVALLTQTTIVGSVVSTDRPLQPDAPRLVFERRGETHVEATTGSVRAKFCLVLASDTTLPPVSDSLLIHDTSIGSHASNAAGLATQIESLQAALAQRGRDLAHVNDFLAKREQFIREGMGVFTTFHQKAIDQHARERARLDGDINQMRSTATDALTQVHILNLRMADRDAQLAQRDATIERLQRELTKGLLRRMLPALRRRLMPLLERIPGLSTAAIIRTSPCFQAEWYLETYPDVRAAGLDPAIHYITTGAREGRDPGPDFSTQYYLSSYADVREADLNPLIHYERFGRAEGRAVIDNTPAPAPETAPTTMQSGATRNRATRVVYISGEPDTPGHLYRVARTSKAATDAGANVTQLRIDEITANRDAIANCDLLAIWRAPLTADLETAIQTAHAAGAQILYDVDDLMFEPDLARADIIDGIRSQGFDPKGTADLFSRIAQAISLADFTSAPTRFLAGRLQRQGKPAFILPNGFDHETWRIARQAVRLRRLTPADGLLRIGYAAGSRTHQADFAVAAPAVARLLRTRPEARLVVFRRLTQTCLDIEEFPDLQGLEHQIEWREMVPLAELPAEIARFDISLAPLEAGNPFCEAKSELKYFESALVEVPVIATPTGVFREMIQPGQTGLLARTKSDWDTALAQLADDPALRARIGQTAYHTILWPYGPERRTDQMRSILAQLTGPTADAARAFELDLRRNAAPRTPAPEIAPHQVEIIQDRMQDAAATIIIPLYNYAHTIIEALDSAAAQTLTPLDLIVIDDCSTDDGADIARTWMQAHTNRFARLLLIRNTENVGLGPTRNIGFANAETPYVIQLDADNRLLPDFAERTTTEANHAGAAFVFTKIRTFGDSDAIIGDIPYQPVKLATGNYIDAMALVRTSAWATAGGYDNVRFGWEDYDLWCRFAEHGLFGTHIPEILAEYRVHSTSMLRTLTDIAPNKRRLITDMRTRHNWVLDGVAAD